MQLLCYYISQRQYIQTLRLDFMDSADIATYMPSFTAPACLVTGSYSGKVLDSSIKLLNRFTYPLKTQILGVFEQVLTINMAVVATSITQA